MEKVKASINFKRYFINEIKFKLNNNEKDQNNIDLQFNGNTTIYHEKNEAAVSLICIMGENESDSPFSLYVSITGLFDYQSDMKDDKLQKLITTNATAILFPYLRAMVTNITSNAGISPVILPTLNINKLLGNANFSK